jgi:hypothetical protein
MTRWADAGCRCALHAGDAGDYLSGMQLLSGADLNKALAKSIINN